MNFKHIFSVFCCFVLQNCLQVNICKYNNGNIIHWSNLFFFSCLPTHYDMCIVVFEKYIVNFVYIICCRISKTNYADVRVIIQTDSLVNCEVITKRSNTCKTFQYTRIRHQKRDRKCPACGRYVYLVSVR